MGASPDEVQESESLLSFASKQNLLASMRSLLTCKADPNGAEISSPVQNDSEANALPPNWEEYLDDESGDKYYYHVITEERTWDRPKSKKILAKTPMTYALMAGHGDAVNLLLDSKVDVNAKDREGRSQLYLACMQDNA